jgi:hypothetical protein
VESSGAEPDATGTARERLLLPNLVIAGVPRAGTTSLFRYLAQHPDICASTKKELAYFEPLLYGEPMAPLESYAREFGHCPGRRYRMEATPNYFFGGRETARVMRQTLDDVRVVVCLREPIERCWSWYRFVHGRARIPKDMGFGTYLDICEELHSTGADGLRANQPFTGLGGSIYAARLEGWLDVFGDRLRIEYFDDLATDPETVVEGLLRWLALDGRAASGFRYEVENRATSYRSRPVQRTAVRVNRWGERFFSHHGRLKRALRTGYYAVNRDRTSAVLEPAARERLAEFYAPHDRRLADVLGRARVSRLPAWLADHDR